MSHLAVAVLFAVAGHFSQAHPQDGDRLTALSQGTILRTSLSINVPANVQEVVFSRGLQLRVGDQMVPNAMCVLSLDKVSKKDRVILAGTNLVIKDTSTDSNRFSGYAIEASRYVKTENSSVVRKLVTVYFESKTITKVYCLNQSTVPTGKDVVPNLNGEPNYPTIGELKAEFGDYLEIQHAEPDVIEGVY